jgi:hypothetical protein
MLETSALKSSLNTELSPVFFATSPLFPDLSTLRQSSGTVTFDRGQLTTDFKTPTGETKGTLSIAQFTTDLSNSLTQLQGDLTFDQGIVTSNLSTPSGDLTGSFPFAQGAAQLISEFVKGFVGTVPFSDGTIDIDIPTVLGQVKGSIEFGNGALVTNLATPFGGYFSSIDFKESDQYAFKFGNVPGVVNFNDGLVILDFQPQTPGNEIGIPINALSGNIAFKDGQATLNIPTPFGSFATSFDLSAFAKTATTNALQGSGTVRFKDGVATIDTTGSLGTIQTTLNLPELVQNIGSTLATVQGTVRFNNGAVTSASIS